MAYVDPISTTTTSADSVATYDSCSGAGQQ